MPEAFSVQIAKSPGIGGEGEGQLVGIQRLVIPVKPFVQLAVFSVSQKRMPGMGELGTDLMGTAGDQLAFHQRKAVFRGQHLIVGLAGFAAGLGSIGDEDPVFLGILEKIALQTPVSGLGCALYDGQISFVQLPVLDLLVHHPQGFCGFCGNDNTTGVSVNPVAQCGSKGVLFSGPPFPFLIQVGLSEFALVCDLSCTTIYRYISLLES